MSDWTEGVMADGAAILRNGQMVTISELLEILNGMEAAIAAEREACAKIADDYAKSTEFGFDDEAAAKEFAAESIRDAIRARSKETP